MTRCTLATLGSARLKQTKPGQDLAGHGSASSTLSRTSLVKLVDFWYHLDTGPKDQLKLQNLLTEIEKEITREEGD